MLNAAITCAQSSPATGQHCQQLYLDITDPAEFPAAVEKALADAGWSEKDGAHFCPRHDPADVGETFEVTTRYAPIVDTGWEVRVPPSPWAETGATCGDTPLPERAGQR